MTFQEMVESLYGLDGDELRHLAWEALLISDGPDAVYEPNEVGDIQVEVVDDLTVDGERRGFTIIGRDGWETASPTLKDTPPTGSTT